MRLGLLKGLAVVSAAQLAAVFGEPAFAQDPVARFFQDRTVTIGVGAAPGGGLDTYARLLSRHLGKHIPGKPNVIIANMPGAGGQIVARHLYNVAPKDGTYMATFFPSVLTDPLLVEAARAIDPSKFIYVGNAKAEVAVCMVRKDVPLKSPSDLLTTEMVVGATTAGSPVVDYPVVEKELLGLKLRITPGYQGTREVGAAVEKGEVHGICGVGWSTIKVQYPDVGKETSFGKIFAQEDSTGDPELNTAGIPLMASLATTEEQRQVLKLLYAQNELSRPYVLPPGVPDDRVAALRKAFMDTTNDPELQTEAARMRIDVAGTSGPDMQKLIEEIYRTPKSILDRLAKALGRGG
jgi:tripartite-type tricarboxylate transporter receptor subunit TctC